MSMTFEEAVEQFDRANAAGEIPRLDGHEGTRSVSDNQRHVAVTATRAALRRASGEGDVSQVPIEPYAESLAAHARKFAEENDHSRPSNYAASVRLFLAGIEGRRYRYRRYGSSRVLSPWKSLYDALEHWVEAEEHQGGIRSGLLNLQDLAVLYGVHSPEELPDRATVDRWAEEEGFSDRSRERMYGAYHRAHEALGDERLPKLKVTARSHERGIRSLDGLDDLLAKAGVTPATNSLSRPQLVALLSPKVAGATRDYVEELIEPSSSAVKLAWGMASRLVAEARRQGMNLSDLSLVNVFERTVVEDVELHPLVAAEISAESVRRVSPLESIVKGWGRASWQNSPLDLVGSVGDEAFAYTHTVRRDLYTAFKVCDHFYGPSMREHEPDRWDAIEQEYRRIEAMIDRHNERRPRKNQKDKARLLNVITLPQLVCIGLPVLARKVRRLRGKYYRRVEQHRRGEISPRAVHEAKTRFFSLLARYVVIAIATDDGLRCKNYAGAVSGRNVFVDPKKLVRKNGVLRWKAIERVETHFRGLEHPQEVRLKRSRDENDRERSRSRELLRGVVDHDLFLNYWQQVRPYNLAQADLIDDETTFDLDHDEFALFVSPQSGNDDGRYTPNQLSVIAGKTLHLICSEVLGRDVPEWGSREHRVEWRELFAIHALRLLTATYWGGVRDEWTYAKFLTDDKKSTLGQKYDRAASGVMQRKYSMEGWEHPEYFNDLMDRIRAGHEVDWGKERRELGLP